jgi:hypothetical protein
MGRYPAAIRLTELASPKRAFAILLQYAKDERELQILYA